MDLASEGVLSYSLLESGYQREVSPAHSDGTDSEMAGTVGLV